MCVCLVLIRCLHAGLTLPGLCSSKGGCNLSASTCSTASTFSRLAYSYEPTILAASLSCSRLAGADLGRKAASCGASGIGRSHNTRQSYVKARSWQKSHGPSVLQASMICELAPGCTGLHRRSFLPCLPVRSQHSALQRRSQRQVAASAEDTPAWQQKVQGQVVGLGLALALSAVQAASAEAAQLQVADAYKVGRLTRRLVCLGSSIRW